MAIKTSRTEFSERFASEARAIAALNHPNICQLYDVGKLADGGDLLTSLAPRDSWFNLPAVVDTLTGRVTPIPSENLSDYQSVGWTPDPQTHPREFVDRGRGQE